LFGTTKDEGAFSPCPPPLFFVPKIVHTGQIFFLYSPVAYSNKTDIKVIKNCFSITSWSISML